ncbi:cellulose binding domain-containing protein [Micromonospora rifamycinica]|uniref:Fibronectin type III domain-containing protein n=1 Tax=Micromonospora rifamycinica TaxID=291594 RepID=A0A109IJS3_9ACTN|nr:cellulose binding domain-containing protein [Micromonospora rifamycinica]KWV31798.1 glucanase [Micromonospora rifamycinica]SCG74785.1 Fibronectin type III domain-containing protein [Micromonospora rifamycinica]
MVGVPSSPPFRRARPGLVAAVVSSIAVLGAGLTAGPAAGAGTAAPVPAAIGHPAPAGVAAPVPGQATATPPGPTAPSTTPNTSPFPPGAPTNVAASQVRTGSVTLTWTAATPGCCAIVGYDITYYMAFDDVVMSASVGNVTTTTISNYIGAGRQYSFRISARDSVGHRSVSSDTLTVVTPVTDTGPDTTPPSAPQNLTIGDVTDSTATLSWSPSTDDVGVRGYNVYRFDGWFTSVVVATVPVTTYTVTLPTSTPLRNLFYVRARDAAGNVSIASNTVTAPTTSTPPTPPTPPPPTCRVGYQNQSEWQGGFVAVVTVQNVTATPVDGWTLTFDLRGDQQITSAWNATVDQSGTTVTASNVDWNRVLAANGSASFGMQGRWNTSNAPPTGFVLNGRPCTVG